MTEKIAAMRKFFVTDKEQARVRRPAGDPEEMARRFAQEGTPDTDRAARRLIAEL